MLLVRGQAYKEERRQKGKGKGDKGKGDKDKGQGEGDSMRGKARCQTGQCGDKPDAKQPIAAISQRVCSNEGPRLDRRAWIQTFRLLAGRERRFLCLLLLLASSAAAIALLQQARNFIIRNMCQCIIRSEKSLFIGPGESIPPAYSHCPPDIAIFIMEQFSFR